MLNIGKNRVYNALKKHSEDYQMLYNKKPDERVEFLAYILAPIVLDEREEKMHGGFTCSAGQHMHNPVEECNSHNCCFRTFTNICKKQTRPTIYVDIKNKSISLAFQDMDDNPYTDRNFFCKDIIKKFESYKEMAKFIYENDLYSYAKEHRKKYEEYLNAVCFFEMSLPF